MDAHHRRILGGFLLLSFAVRTYLAWRFHGFQTGDDLEILQQALHRSTGFAHAAWEVRSLFIPDVIVAPFLRLAWAAGLRDPLQLAFAARLPFVFFSILNIALVYRLGSRWYGGSTASWAAILYGSHWIPIVYGSTLLPRVIAVSCILTAALLLEDDSSSAAVVLAGVIASLAATARYSEIIFAASLAALFGARRPRRLPLFLAGCVAGFILFAGLYDWLTWGRWFGSLIEFAQLTFVRGDASSLTVAQAPWWYLANAGRWIALSALPLLAVAVRDGDRRRFLAFVAFPIACLSTIFHKEFRYVQVIVPFVCLFAAHGFTLWYSRPERRRLAIACLALSIPLGLGGLGNVMRRSTNAVDAARWLASQHFTDVALSQPWAYGGSVFLGSGVRVIDLDVPPRADTLRAVPGDCSAIAMFASDVDALPAQWEIRVRARAKRMFSGRGGRTVIAFYTPCPTPSPLLSQGRRSS